jgi:hypothetical protein
MDGMDKTIGRFGSGQAVRRLEDGPHPRLIPALAGKDE